jgi:leader peptidase (prepilin peptidase)/N-methyltransferase
VGQGYHAGLPHGSGITLEAYTWLPLLLAPFIGSFLGVLIQRLPEGRPVLLGRSACEACGHRLSPLELVPLLSWLVQRGRCRACGARLGWFYPAVELAALAVAAMAGGSAGGPDWVWAGCGLGWTLLALAWIDARHFRLPDALTLPLIPAGLLATWALAPEAVLDHAVAALAGYASFALVAAGYRRWRGRAGLGAGDAKLLAGCGAWLGLEALPWLVLLAALLGLGLAVALALWRGARLRGDLALPFGPALALACWLLWLVLQPGRVF